MSEPLKWDWDEIDRIAGERGKTFYQLSHEYDGGNNALRRMRRDDSSPQPKSVERLGALLGVPRECQSILLRRRDILELPRFDAHPVSDEDFVLFRQLDAKAYRIAGYNNEFLQRWRDAYPGGCIGFFLNEQLVGGFGAWPLGAVSSRRMMIGRFDEEDLEVDSTANCGIWYLGGLFLNATGHILQMVDHCFAAWFRSSRNHLCAGFETFAVATTPGIRRALDDAGFATVRQTSANWPLHHRRWSGLNELRVAIEAFLTRFGALPTAIENFAKNC